LRLDWGHDLQDEDQNHRLQDPVTFSLAGYNPGDTVVMAVDVKVVSTGNFDWTLDVSANYASGLTASGVFSGKTPVYISEGTMGQGWGIDGVDHLVPVCGGLLWVHGN